MEDSIPFYFSFPMLRAQDWIWNTVRQKKKKLFLSNKKESVSFKILDSRMNLMQYE